jgi:chromosome segregation ATPase
MPIERELVDTKQQLLDQQEQCAQLQEALNNERKLRAKAQADGAALAERLQALNALVRADAARSAGAEQQVIRSQAAEIERMRALDQQRVAELDLRLTEVADLRNERDRLSAASASAAERFRHAGQRTAELERETTDLRAKLVVAESRVPELARLMSNLEQGARVADAEIKSLRRECDQLKAASASEREIAEHPRRAEQERAAELERELADLRVKLSTAERRASDATRQASDFQEALRRTAVEVEALRQELSQLKAASTPQPVERKPSTQAQDDPAYRPREEARPRGQDASQTRQASAQSDGAPGPQARSWPRRAHCVNLPCTGRLCERPASTAPCSRCCRRSCSAVSAARQRPCAGALAVRPLAPAPHKLARRSASTQARRTRCGQQCPPAAET